MSGSQQLLLGGSVQQAVDPFFYSVTSLLHGDGTNGGQNNTFLDSSSNNFTITRNGNTTQGSFSPFSQTGWGAYFEGGASGGYITSSTSADYTFGTGDFTVEGWVYMTGTGTGIFQQGTSNFPASTTNTVALGTTGGTSTWQIYAKNVQSTSTATWVANTWYHYALVRSGTTTTLYINGTAVITVTADSTNYTGTYFGIGSIYGTGSTERFTGYMSNLRVVKGVAVYTANFTPPTSPLSSYSSGTTALLTLQSNRYIDTLASPKTLTVTSNTSIQPFSPFNPTTPYSTSAVGGSGYFDGSGDYLSAGDQTAFEFGSGDYTVELWWYPTSSGDQNIIGKWDTGGTEWILQWRSAGYYRWASGGSVVSDSSTITLRLNSWNHVAVTKSGTSLRIYTNGAQINTTATEGTISATSTALTVGASQLSSSPLNVTGYMSDVRILKGTAQYTGSTYTVPTAPLTAIANTSLLLNFTNGAIFDNAADADYETVGNAQISTSVKKYGTGSMAFDGTGDYLVTDAPSTQLMTFGTGDFTIECWAYATSLPGSTVVFIDFRPSGTEGLYPTIYFNVGGVLTYFTNSADRIVGPALAVNTWYHIAVCRVAGQTKMFLNGTQVGSTYVDTNNYVCGSQRPAYATWGKTLGSNNYTGYIDDLRISKGVGRYPYNFTPPTAEFPNIGGTVTLTADPYFDYTTLLLPGNGTNGAQNNTFLDSSTNAFSITRNGNTTQGTFSPFSQTGWGNYFDGTGDYLTFPNNTAFAFGTGAFTIEFWVNGPLNNDKFFLSGRAAIGTMHITTGGAVGSTAGALRYVGSSTITSGSVVVTNDTWNHCAIVRDGSNNITLYVNGTSVGTGTDTTNYTTTSGTWYIASNDVSAPANTLTAYLSNLRIVKGTAVYTANFTPSTTPLTAISGTSLLTCQSNRFIDNSTNAFTITRNGDVSVQAFSPFNPTASWSAATNGGSGYFDGSGDFLTAADSTAWDLSGDYTIEMWLYVTSTPSSPTFFQLGESSNYLLWYLASATKYLTLAGSASITASTAMSLNAWNHVALVRSGGGTNNTVMYLNGVNVGQTTNTTSFTGSASNGVRIGAEYPSGFYVNGYISDVRIVKGTAVYTGAFTPPTAPLTAIANTQLLTNFTNAGIYDATSKNDLETVGNAQISTTQSKFGGSSMSFDGTGDYLYRAVNPNPLGSGDWTIEFWYYQSGGSSYRAAVSTRTAADGGATATVFCGFFGNNMYYDGSTSGGINVVGSATIANSTWYHCAYVRFGSTVTMYLNGVSQGSVSDSNNKSNPDVWVGGQNTLYYLNGYIDDLRITKGIARYTSNFTPPTTAFLTL